MTFGRRIVFTSFCGKRATYSVSGCETFADATFQVVQFALADGWTQPRWWQWWRWHDTRIKIEDFACPTT